MTKKSSGSTGKSGASLAGKGIGGKTGSSGNKLSSLGTTGNKSGNFGSTASKATNFGSTASKATNFGSTASKTSHFGSTANTFGSTSAKPTIGGLSLGKDKSSSRTPSFFGADPAKFSSGLKPSTSHTVYDTTLYRNPKKEKSSAFGIIWIPGKKRNKKKDQAFSAIHYDKTNQRSPSMYNVMSGGSPDFQVHGKRDEETFLSEKLKGPIATVASASTASAIADTAPNDTSELEEKLLSSDKEENKDGQGAGDATNKDKDDPNYSENNGGSNGTENKPDKQCDKVDSVFVSPSSPLKPPPPQSVTSNQQEDDECIVKCLYYTLQCCDCVLM